MQLTKTGAFFILFMLVLLSTSAVFIVYFMFTRPALVISLLEPIVPTPMPPAPITLRGVGVLGDSQSDEYRADDDRGSNYPSTTKNWVELLSERRNINFGEWGVREEPRRMGYAYNWARSGATAASLIESGQHVGLAEQVKNGQVNVVVIFIGANDYAPYLSATGYEPLYNGTLSQAAIRSKRHRLVADITTAVDTIREVGDPRIILVLVPDWGKHLGVRIAFPYPDQRYKVTEAIERTNSELRELAREQRLVVVDPNRFFDGITRDEMTRIKVGDVTLEQLLLNNDPRNMYVEDGVHLGTVVNGLFANEIISALNTQISNDISSFSEEEILSAAGL